MSADANDILLHRDALKANRSQFEAAWQEIADLGFPRASEVTTISSPGANRRAKMLSNAMELAGLRFASSIHNLMTGEGQPWFYLATKRKALMKSRDVRLWLQDTQQRLYDVFNSPDSGFHLATHEKNLQLGFFGTSPLFIIDRPGQMPFYMALPLPECLFDRDQFNRIDSVIRTYRKTAKELLQSFPEARQSRNVMAAFEKNSQNWFTCVHAIRPRRDVILGSRNNLAMAWESVYVLQDDKLVLQESGFESFPAVVPRWTVSASEVYGRGPGDAALADTRLLMEARREQIRGRQMVANPPMDVPEGGYSARLAVVPGALNYLQSGTQGAKPLHTVDVQGLLAADTMAADCVQAIKDAFYDEAFHLEGPTTDKGSVQHMSATEVTGRLREKLGIFGPIFSRQKTEDLGPTISRSLYLMEKNGLLLPAPPELENEEVFAEYVSPLAIAQESGEVSTIIEGMNIAGAIEMVSPGAKDILDGDRVLARALQALRFPEEGLRSEEEIAAVREARARQDMQMQQAQMAQMQAKAMKDSAAAMATAQ